MEKCGFNLGSFHPNSISTYLFCAFYLLNWVKNYHVVVPGHTVPYTQTHTHSPNTNAHTQVTFWFICTDVTSVSQSFSGPLLVVKIKPQWVTIPCQWVVFNNQHCFCLERLYSKTVGKQERNHFEQKPGEGTDFCHPHTC